MDCYNVEPLPFSLSLSLPLSLSLDPKTRTPMLPLFLSGPLLSLRSRAQSEQRPEDGRGAMGSLGHDGPNMCMEDTMEDGSRDEAGDGLHLA